MRVADYITATLVAHGISDIFLVTGGGSMHLNDAIGRCPGLSYICCHHEQACAMAAESSFWREASWTPSICWMSSIMVEEGCRLNRDALRDALKKRNIDTRPAFPAISQYPIWPRKQTAQPMAMRIGDRGIDLPSGVKLSRDQITYICDSIRASVT